MKSFRALSIILTSTALLLAHQALALNEDNKTMNGADGAARFGDPDDQLPIAVNLSGGSTASSGNVDPASVRYDYDPASGAYVPHKN